MNITNCKNCGAVMEYSKQYYGSMYKCPYCGTEHHIDLLGRVEEYKIKFTWQGKLIEAYLSSFSADYPTDSFRSIDGTIKTNFVGNPIFTFEFISMNVEDLPEK